MEILLAITVGTLCVVCFFIGAKVGQQASKGETIVTPVRNPIQLMKEYRERRHAEEEQSKLDTILQNIERYDGTSNGQTDVPR